MEKMAAALEQTSVEAMASTMMANRDKCIVEQAMVPSSGKADKVDTPRVDQDSATSSQYMHLALGSQLAAPAVRLKLKGVLESPVT